MAAKNTATNKVGVLHLLGAPDDTIGERTEHNKAGQSMRVQLVQDLTKEMRDNIQHGRAQAVLGSNPYLRIGNTRIPLSSSVEKFRREVYEDGEDGLRYQGLVSHNLAERRVEEVTGGVDAAVARLNATMAGLQKEKEDNRVRSNTAKATTMPSSRLVVPKGRVFSSPAGRSQHAHSSSSTSLSVPGTKSLGAGSLSPQPGAVDRSQVRRWILIHMLAAKPVAQDLILKRSRIPLEECLVILQKIATREGTEGWKLNDRWYKELEPYQFKYSTKEDREAAIQTAVKIFDRLRISKDDKLWQRLLPVEERGSGKTLSKLNLSGPSAALTPLANRHSTKSSSPGINKAQSQVRPSSSSSSSAKIGIEAERSKQRLPNKKPESASATAVKVGNEHDQSGAGSETDMGARGIARRVPKVAAGQKRKALTEQYKSNAIITKSDDEDDEDEGAPLKAEQKDDDEDVESRVKRLKTEMEGSQKVIKTAVVTAETAKTVKTTPTPAQSSPSAPSSSKTTTMKTTPVAKPKSVTPIFAGWSNASLASKIKRVTRPQSPARATSSSQTKQLPSSSQQQQQQQVNKTSSNDSKLKAKVIPPGAERAKSSAGLVPSPSLPPKPNACGGTAITSATHSAGKKPGSQLGTNGLSTNGGKASRPNATTNELHKRAPSTSTISSAASSVFTPAAHRNSISSSQSSSSMVSTRADARKLKRPAGDDLPIAAKPPIKKVQTTKPGITPGSSPLTDLGSTPGQVKSESTPSQVKSEGTPGPAKVDTQSKPRESTAPTSTRSLPRSTPQPTARSSQLLTARVRLDNLRKQYTKVYTSFVNTRVAHDKQTDHHDDDLAMALHNVSTRRADMEQVIRSLMDEVQDYTFWNGVPPKFVTPHRSFLKEQVNKMNEELDELQSQYLEYAREERPEVLKQKMLKLEEDKKGLVAILFPPDMWEFVDSEAGA